jgi:hypothetical protein
MMDMHPEDWLKQADDATMLPAGMRARCLAAASRALETQSHAHRVSWAVLLAGPFLWVMQQRQPSLSGAVVAEVVVVGPADPLRAFESIESGADRQIAARLPAAADDWALVDESRLWQSSTAAEVRRWLG